MRFGPARSGRRAAAALLAAALLVAGAAGARAGAILDRVKAMNAISCGAEERPGVAAIGEDGTPAGLAVDLCRAVAIAVLGPRAKVDFRLLEAQAEIEKARAGGLDIVFLSGGAVLADQLADRLLLGPSAFVETESVMVPEASSVRTLRDLAGRSICFMIGTGAQRTLEAFLERAGIDVMRLGFGEDVELRDAYNVGRCGAVAGEASFLAQVRRDGGVHALRSRLLDPPLGIDPVYLATGVDDARWSAIAADTLASLILASAPRSGWTGAGADTFAAAATPLGFREGWLKDVLTSVGSYADIWRRNFGTESDLGLRPGPNAPWPAGLLLAPASP